MANIIPCPHGCRSYFEYCIVNGKVLIFNTNKTEGASNTQGKIWWTSADSNGRYKQVYLIEDTPANAIGAYVSTIGIMVLTSDGSLWYKGKVVFNIGSYTVNYNYITTYNADTCPILNTFTKVTSISNVTRVTGTDNGYGFAAISNGNIYIFGQVNADYLLHRDTMFNYCPTPTLIASGGFTDIDAFRTSDGIFALKGSVLYKIRMLTWDFTIAGNTATPEMTFKQIHTTPVVVQGPTVSTFHTLDYTFTYKAGSQWYTSGDGDVGLINLPSNYSDNKNNYIRRFDLNYWPNAIKSDLNTYLANATALVGYEAYVALFTNKISLISSNGYNYSIVEIPNTVGITKIWKNMIWTNSCLGTNGSEIYLIWFNGQSLNFTPIDVSDTFSSNTEANVRNFLIKSSYSHQQGTGNVVNYVTEVNFLTIK